MPRECPIDADSDLLALAPFDDWFLRYFWSHRGVNASLFDIAFAAMLSVHTLTASHTRVSRHCTRHASSCFTLASLLFNCSFSIAFSFVHEVN